MKKINGFKVSLIGINVLGLMFVGNCSLNNYMKFQENRRLNSLMDEYKNLKEQNDNYNILKNSYLKILEEENLLNGDNKSLEDKINILNIEIVNLEKQINDVNNKINELS